jgi:hypothetical protein
MELSGINMSQADDGKMNTGLSDPKLPAGLIILKSKNLTGLHLIRACEF